MATPTRPRVLGSTTNVTSTPSTPRSILNSSPSKLRPRAEASPQVKAAIAAMKAAKQQMLNNKTPSSASRRASTDSSSTRNDSLMDGMSWGSSSGRLPARTSDGTESEGWVIEPMKSMVKKAKNTGRLNIASRSLTSVPALAFETLIPLTSPYHSAFYVSPTPTPAVSICSNSSSVLLSPSRDFSDAFSIEQEREEEDAEEEEIEWAQLDLKVLNLSSNQLAVLGEQIAGFEDLESLDVHSNLLTILPLSIQLFTHLTFLNISFNHLSEFPSQLLALSSLVSLDLSRNNITQIYATGNDWREEMSDVRRRWESRMIQANGSPGRSPTSRGRVHTLIDSASPTKPDHRSSSPFPNLINLNLSHNPLSSQSSIAESTFLWPRRLVKLDLSNVQLIEGGLSLSAISQLEDLEVLNLSYNSLTVQTSGTMSSQPFQSLKSFDLSENNIDSLAGLDWIFASSSPGSIPSMDGRKFMYSGLPKSISNLIENSRLLACCDNGSYDAKNLEGAVLEIQLEGNRMESEEKRRRAIYLRMKNGDLPSEIAQGELPVEEIRSIADLQERMVELDIPHSIEIEDSRPANISTSAATLTSPPDTDPVLPSSSASLETLSSNLQSPTMNPQLLAFFSSHFSPSTKSLNLRSLQLSTLPSSIEDLSSVQVGVARTKEGEEPTVVPTVIDLAKNEIGLLPLRSIICLNWSSRLRRLNLSFNQITGTQLMGRDSEWKNIKLDSLLELDLGNNNLGNEIGLGRELKGDGVDSSSSTAGLFEFIAIVAPNLASLDLTFNRLTTLAGLSLLLLPSSTSSPRQGLRSLRLSGNRISEISGLVEVATLIKGKDTKSGKELVELGWRCDEIDLSANAIARLPPALGHLPLALSLQMAGNTFRIPSRDISEGGGRVLMEYLRARVS